MDGAPRARTFCPRVGFNGTTILWVGVISCGVEGNVGSGFADLRTRNRGSEKDSEFASFRVAFFGLRGFPRHGFQRHAGHAEDIATLGRRQSSSVELLLLRDAYVMLHSLAHDATILRSFREST